MKVISGVVTSPNKWQVSTIFCRISAETILTRASSGYRGNMAILPSFMKCMHLPISMLKDDAFIYQEALVPQVLPRIQSYCGQPVKDKNGMPGRSLRAMQITS